MLLWKQEDTVALPFLLLKFAPDKECQTKSTRRHVPERRTA